MIADGDGLSKMQWAPHLLIITLGKPRRFFIGVIVIMKSILSYGKVKRYWCIEVKTAGRQSSKGRGPFLKKFTAHEVITTAVGGGDIPVEALVSMSAEEIFQSVNR
jgi:hypothetical protein